jgi:hypothetical protein
VQWLEIARQRSVVRRAFTMAAIVAPILILINHSDAIMRGDISPARLFRMALTFFVPYTVSTVSSVAAIRERQRATAADDTRPNAA